MHIPDPREAQKAIYYFKPFIRHFRNCSRVIDVASGQGHFLRLLKEAGINAEGIEIDEELCRQSRESGLAVTQGNFFDFLKSTAPKTYDGANTSHIVEHFTPVQVEELFSLLYAAVKPGALLVIITPNIANMRRAVGDFWRDPTHVRPYPVSALQKLLRRTGWEVVESGGHTDRKPSVRRAIIYGIRNALLGRYWVDDDLFVIARRPA